LASHPIENHPHHSLIEEVSGLTIAAKIQTVGDAETGAWGLVRGWDLVRSDARVSITRVLPGGHREHGRRIVYGWGKDRHTIERTAGWGDPAVEISPRVGLSPITLQKDAGTRPDPPVPVPSAKLTRPVATATVDPELDPPGIYAASTGLS
jgi:hypothetical protein